MSKRDEDASVPIEDWKPFSWEAERLWVPYYAKDRWRMHDMTAEKAWQGIHLAIRTLTSASVVVPFARAALRKSPLGDWR